MQTFKQRHIPKFQAMSDVVWNLLQLGVFSLLMSIVVAQSATQISFIPRILPMKPSIVFGVDVLANDRWPWQVFIELDNGNNQCGGTLISNQWILTAAHCFDGGMKATKIVMGTNSRSNKFRHAVVGNADIACCHEKYNIVTLDYDICLINLAQPINPTQTLKPVSLPTAGSKIPAGKECYITGWGYNEKQVLPDILQEATVKVVERQTCIDWHKPHNTLVVNNTVCAGHEKGGPDSCGGDSGGPMVCWNELDQFVLQGVTSYGPSYCGAAKLPGIYTKVSDYIDWIHEKMNNPCIETEWGPWSGGCTVTCGVGTQSKTRACFTDIGQQVNPSQCNGLSKNQGLCVRPPCPTYKWSDWNEGICSKTCGNAVRTDVRYCVTDNGTRVDPTTCTGPPTRTVNCALPNCPVPHFWGSWTSVCSVTCGNGVRTRTRVCTNSLGLIAADISKCFPGLNTEQDSCQLEACSSISWGEWGPWSPCQPDEFTTCLGLSYSTRTCSLSGLMWFQGFCSGDFQRSRHCIWGTCTAYDLEFVRQPVRLT